MAEVWYFLGFWSQICWQSEPKARSGAKGVGGKRPTHHAGGTARWHEDALPRGRLPFFIAG
jgi:hypothetical protein